MIVIFIRTLITFTVLIIVMRLMGKRQIGEMQPFEFIVTLIIADLACVPMSDVSIPLIYGIVAVLTLFLLHQILTIIEQIGGKTKKFISGKPSVVINKNGVDVYELKKNNMNVDDLIESMRAQGYFSLDELDYAIFESNGKLSALENENIKINDKSIPILMINNGKIEKKNLSVAKISETSLISFLKRNNTSIKKTEVLTMDGNGRTYIKERKKKYKILKYRLAKGVKW